MSVQDVAVPDIGDFEQVEVIEVHIAAGDLVHQDDPLITLESDKASVEVPAPFAGKIVEVLLREGDHVSQGSLIVKMEAGEAQPLVPPPAPDGHQEAEHSAPPPPPKPASPPPPPAGDEAVHAGPGVRRLATELGVDLTQTQASGRDGLVTREDVRRAFLRQQEAAKHPPASAAPSAPPVLRSAAARPDMPPPSPEVHARFGEVEMRPLSRLKRIAGPRLQNSWQTTPHVTHHDEADITDLDKLRKEFAAKRENGLTLMPFIVRACIHALKTWPQFNASLTPDGKDLALKRYYHIGIAVDTPEGLIVPVIRDADKKSIARLADEMADLAERARSRKLKPEELQGASFTISNLGGIGGTGFSPVIYDFQAAILGVSRGRIMPVWDGQTFAPRLMMPIGLSYDHRIIDGAEAARFVRLLAGTLSDMTQILLE